MHGRTPHCLGYGFGVAKVVPLALEKRLHELPRHQLHVLAEGQKLLAQMVAADASPDANQAQRAANDNGKQASDSKLYGVRLEHSRRVQLSGTCYAK